MGYPADAQFSRDDKFMGWVSEFDRIATEFGAKHEGHPYGGPVADSTGLDCWFDYYDSGYTPQSAFDEDRAYWE